MEDEALDSRGRNITLGVFGLAVVVIAGLVFNNYRVKQDRITGMKSGDPAVQAAKVHEMMVGFANDGAIAEQLQGERPSVRLAAVRALRALATQNSIPEKDRKDAAKLTVPFLKDSDQPVKDLASQSLVAMGPEIALDAAVGALGDSDAGIKGGVQGVCQSFAPYSILPLLAFSGKDGTKSVLRGGRRTFAGNALYEISKKDERWKSFIILGEEAVRAREKKLTPEQTRAELKAFLGAEKDLLGPKDDPIYGLVDYLDPTNGNEDDQNNAISVLDRIGDVRAVPFLVHNLDVPATRRAAVGALGRLGDKSATLPLLRYLPTDETNRLEIVIALGRIADPRATDALIMYGLGSVSRPVRSAASDSLRNIGAPALPALVRAAQVPDPTDPGFYKVEGAARALAGLRLPQATQVAVSLLRHPAANVREAAADALAESRSPEVISPLIASFEDTDGRVSGFAARSVSAFGEQAVPQLVAALSSPKRVYWASMAIRYIGPPAFAALQQQVATGQAQGALHAASLLGSLGDARAIDTLKAALAKRPDPDFQFTANSSIDRLSGGESSASSPAPAAAPSAEPAAQPSAS